MTGPPTSSLEGAAQWLSRRLLVATDRCGQHEPLPGWSWRPRLSDYDIWLVREGAGQAHIGSSDPVALGAGTLLVLRPGDRGTFAQDESRPVSVTFCHFRIIDPASGVAQSIPEPFAPGRVHQIEPSGPVAGTPEATLAYLVKA